MGIFGAFTVAPWQRVNTVPYFADAGVVAYGPFQSRARDFAALGVVYGSYNNAPPRASAPAASLIPAPNNEETLEATYGYTIKRGLLLQPGLQYIIHPKGDASIPSTLPPNSRVPNAFAIGMNIVANF
jgi:carbohydrate-selective porin OprB